MLDGTRRLVRYVRTWFGHGGDVVEEEVTLDRGDRTVPGTLLRPAGTRGPLPGWVVLHGITRPGRDHATLRRFVTSLAASRAAVLVPEIPEWIELELAPEVTAPTVAAAARHLRAARDTGPVGLVGFSFGAPQALIASTREELRGAVAGIAAFGGYCDLARTFRFQLTGAHEWKGVRERIRPDPYGRWIVGANFLPLAPGHEDAEDVARALHELARVAGDRGVPSWDPALDELKEELRRRVAPARREVFDTFAPPATAWPGGPEGELLEDGHADELVGWLMEGALRATPLMELGPFLGEVDVPVHLLHGRDDALIPYTETLRLAERMPGEAPERTTVTELFGHSAAAGLRGIAHFARESVRFARALSGVLTIPG